MAKLSLTSILSGFFSNTQLNANFSAISTAMENTLSRDGTAPNTMAADIDMNSNKLLNVAEIDAGIVKINGTSVVATGTVSAVASAITNTPAGNIASTDVQAAINELDAEKQPLDAGLTSISGLTTAADKMIYTSALDTYAVADLTAYGRSLVAVANEAAFKALVNLEPGIDVQAYDAELAAIAGLTSAANKVPYFTGIGTASTLDFTDDTTLAANSATTIPSEHAVKTYVDSKASNLLTSYTVTGTAVTNIQFTGLDINTHKSYRIEADIILTGGVSVSMYVEADTTATNYYVQELNGAGTGANAARSNNAVVTGAGSASDTTAVISLSRVNGRPVANSSSNASAGTVGSVVVLRNWGKTATVTNITQLDFIASVANTIGVGSTIRIYRGDN